MCNIFGFSTFHLLPINIRCAEKLNYRKEHERKVMARQRDRDRDRDEVEDDEDEDDNNRSK